MIEMVTSLDQMKDLTEEDKMRLNLILGMLESFPQLKEPLRKELNKKQRENNSRNISKS